MSSIAMRGDRDLALAPVPREGRPEVVVVTGASAGVGRAVARRFAAEGAHVGLIARGLDGLDGALRDVEELGGKALVLPADVADAEALDDAATRVEAEWGPIDIWINNATTTVFSRVMDIPPEEFRRVTEVTYLGYVHGTLSALKRMVPRDRGTIVQVGSALAYRGIPLQAAYCAGKHAIQGFTEALRCELLHDKSQVHVTMVHLPAINTPQFGWNKTRLPRHPMPVPPIYQPEVAAEAIHYAAHVRRREVMVGFPTLKAVYGNRIAPSYADRKLAEMGYEAQQTDELIEENRPDNLWQPLPGDRGAHGRFDDRAHAFSPQLWASMHRGWLGVGGALLGAAAMLALWRGDGRDQDRPLPEPLS